MTRTDRVRARTFVPSGQCTVRPAHPAAAGARAVVVAACILGAAASGCAEPRARPAPPSVRIVMEPRLAIASPGILAGSVVVFDVNGVDSVHVRVDFGDGSTLGDSLFFANGDPFQDTLPILWQIPSGLSIRTSVKVVARARSYIGFTASDSLLTAIGDTLPQSL